MYFLANAAFFFMWASKADDCIATMDDMQSKEYIAGSHW